MKLLNTSWPVLRIVRLLLAGFFLYDGLMEFNPIMLLIAVLLAWQALANTGCASGGCAVDRGA